jgi:Glutamine amidotransferase class-I
MGCRVPYWLCTFTTRCPTEPCRTICSPTCIPFSPHCCDVHADDGTIMAVRHRQYPDIQGVQFHPESIITQNGKRIVANFVASVRANGATAASEAAAPAP